MRAYAYGDESGNFDFSDQQGASRYFILTTVVLPDHAIEADLMDLRRQSAWEGEPLTGGFHATNDKQRVRDLVFEVVARHDFRVDATILEKRKADPGRRLPARLYSLAWYIHLSGLVPDIVSEHDELQLFAASLGTEETRSEFGATVEVVAKDHAQSSIVAFTMWPSATSPLLQVTDYCAWAMQRRWERGDFRSYELVHDKIASEFDAFR